ncbi:Hydrogen peroxide-inducible genes activator [Vibrio thalassae]|uniref:Hydrogen peroxide-inducible genes activator n=1 Tax=Vibrio thalassae TaxID=1243014 RepID=A0A240EMP9_9VIBR|nr:LysR substrate-binding domain-containing protein [Vibrio thalassae]SNX49250.1 Hydrogen peroxide-inducible genes activator [Vibrio thalassae]
MDIEALRSLLAFSETGSFTRAAKQINRTQSAFSAQMKKLESETGTVLFERNGRNRVLSEAGLTLKAHAEQILSLHDAALHQVKRYQNKTALRLGCPEDYNDTILPDVVAAINQAEPTCSIQIFSQPSVVLRTWLDEGKLDAAIVTRAADSEEGYWLESDKGVWIAAHDFDTERLPLPLVLFQTDCKYHAAALDSLAKQGVSHRLVACCNTASAQRALVASGVGIGAMGRLSTNEQVKILNGMPSLPSVDIVLLTAATPHPSLRNLFIN